MSDANTTDRAVLARDAYADARHLAARRALYDWQTPSYDLPGIVTTELEDVGGTVIDVGCGSGAYLRHLVTQRPDLHVIGLDVSPGIMTGVPAPVVLGDAQQLPFADSTASAVVAAHMLYHVDDIDRAVAELRRVLRPGGIAVVSTNSATDKSELDDLWARSARDALGVQRGPHRVSLSSRFTLEEAPAILGRHFSSVRTIELPGTISVDEPTPVIAHLASYRTWADRRGVPFDATLEHARRRVTDIIDQQGHFGIGCLGGLLICQR